MSKLRKFFGTFVTYIVILVVSTLVGYGGAEAYYRFVLYSEISKTVDNAALWIQNQTLTHQSIDDLFGRHTVEIPKGLFKINTHFDIAVAHPINGTLNFSVQSNNLGVLSDHDYRLERDPLKPEYRIVVLGDSLTGPTTSTYQWVDTIEEVLNAKPDLRRKVGGKTFRVYNLGWVAAGFETFRNAYEKVGQYLDPDLVVVNYIEIDFPRTNAAQLSSESVMVPHALANLRPIRALNPNLLLTVMPTFDEAEGTVKDFPRTKRLMAADPSFKVVIMRDHLPVRLGRDQIATWYNLPWDAHYSDRGGELYARAMASVIAERITGEKYDFSDVPSKHSAEVLPAGTAPTREITNSISRVSTNWEALARIRTYIKEHMLDGKVRKNFYPYVLHRLLGSGTDGVTIPYTKPLKYGFEKIAFGNSPDDVAYLGLACLSEPVSLSNPECFHNYHMFVKGADEFPNKSKTAHETTLAEADEAGPCRNLLRNGDFADWPAKSGTPPSTAVAAMPMDVAKNWGAVADGTEGKGKAVFSRLDFAADQAAQLTATPHYIRFAQEVGSTGGWPSLTQIVGPATTLAGQNAAISFLARAPKGKVGFRILMGQYYSTKSGVGTDYILYDQPIDLSAEWKRYSFLTRVGPLRDISPGDLGPNSLRISFTPVSRGQEFTVDLADVQFEPRKPTPFVRRPEGDICSAK